MKIEDLLSEISKDGKIIFEKIEEDIPEISISIKRENSYERVLRIYPKVKTAEFLDINEEWEELIWALEVYYKEFPGLRRITDYLNKEKYRINF